MSRLAFRTRLLVPLLGAALLLVQGSAAAAAAPESGLDGRAWEMVSPVFKNGGEIEGPAAADPGALQAAAGGGALSYGSTASFGPAAGAGPVSQYAGSRGDAGWSFQDLTPPQISGTYASGAYQAFSSDLSRGLLSSGWRCRDGASACIEENPPLAAGAPAGYRNLYLWQGGAYLPLITIANAPALGLAAEDFNLSAVGVDPSLRRIAISTCARLTADAVEVTSPSGCDAAAPNLYLWSEGTLRAINLPPGETETEPGATLAAPSGAISADGSRVYWRGSDGNLYLRQFGTATVQVDAIAGGGGEFQQASEDGRFAFFLAGGHLYRFDAVAGSATDLTPSGGVQGVLGASSDGGRVYYVTTTGLYLWSQGTAVKVAGSADAGNYPPATGTARVTADGGHLAFVSSASLTGYSTDGKAQVYVYDANTARLFCASCNTRGNVPAGPSTIPAARMAGGGSLPYKPRALSADGTRVFFDSEDSIVLQDTNDSPDVYEWEAVGTGGCVKAAGCVGLISSGRLNPGWFVDASTDGTDVFFLTDTSLVPGDPEGFDVYDARAGGGFPVGAEVLPCVGDDCQGPPPGPDDPVPSTSYLQAPPNPPLQIAKQKTKKRKGHAAKKHGRKKQAAKKHGHGKRGGRR